MNHLRRELAPVTDSAWREVDAEATRALTTFLAAAQARRRDRAAWMGARGREPRVSDWIGHLTGRRRGRLHARCRANPRTSYALLPCTAGARCDRPRKPIPRSHGLGGRSPQGRAQRGRRRVQWLRARPDRRHRLGLAARPCSPRRRLRGVSPRGRRAVATLRGAGVDGPYGIALGPRCYTGVIETTQKGGYPVLEQLRLITGGPIAWAQALDGSVVMSLRGGDFELTLGEDFAIGFVGADDERVQLYLEESLAFRAHSPEAAVALADQT